MIKELKEKGSNNEFVDYTIDEISYETTEKGKQHCFYINIMILTPEVIK